MNKNEMRVFNFTDYKKYLKYEVQLSPNKGRGARAALAKAMSCQTSYLARVLNGNAHLSLEQAEKGSRHLSHTTQESYFFLLLVQWNRAGTVSLKKILGEQIQKLAQDQNVIKERFNLTNALNNDSQAIYYSAWYFAAVHILVTIPEYQTKLAMAQRLNLSLPKVTEILDFLQRCGLVKFQQNHFVPGDSVIHLGRDSFHFNQHHMNWRMKSVQSLDQYTTSESLHYSSVVSMSREDSARVHSLLVNAIAEIRSVVRKSPEEDLYCYAMDLFRV